MESENKGPVSIEFCLELSIDTDPLISTLRLCHRVGAASGPRQVKVYVVAKVSGHDTGSISHRNLAQGS